ncbi:sodium transporter [Pedobacter frigiditerrae]|uniref:Sodium transporter n=1 Tax=Pedobacter frigiditerrae TaxID=2530452 RepID=A0A4R0MQM5_9SPHI|nr:sodium:solute symporter family protein [Pedobacter frigiditerrae]TCC88572.1 sodium transporter [Pedobacter frigiditerrae]
MNQHLDIIVIFIFSAIILCIGLMFSRTAVNMKSFFAGGESVPWFIGGLSLFMSFFSAGTFVAWGSVAYKYGWVSISIQWTMAFGALIAGMFIAPRWKRTGNLTAAEYIQHRLGSKVQKLYIYIFMIVSLFIKGAVLYPVAKLVSTSLGFPLAETTIVLGMVMIAYTAAGGLWAVMVTDILQFVVLTAAVLIILPLAIHEVGGLASFTSRAPKGFFDALNGEYTFSFLFAFVLYHIFYIGGNWTFIQRYTSVDSPKSSSKVAYLFAALYLICPVIWMLPPMIYRVIDPGLQGLDTENAYLKICQLVLPPGLMGLMLTGMYFSTSATANTTLNVVSAVFTNDVYKNRFKPDASDKELMKVARISSWGLGILMIVIALIVPMMGGMVEVVLTVAAITAGPLLAPPLWSLFSKRLAGKETILITVLTLSLNLFFKMILPVVNGFKLNRGAEMLMGVGVPLLLLIINELWQRSRISQSNEYVNYLRHKEESKKNAVDKALEREEVLLFKKQNKFGLKVIAFSLLVTAIILLALSFFTLIGKSITAIMGMVVFVLAIIPWLASKKVSQQIAELY